MAQASIKISQITKDFNLKSKDVIDTFSSELGIEKKSGATVDVAEFELFMQKMTLSHQIKNIDAYLGGETKISIKKEEVKAEAKSAAKAEVKPEVKVESKSEAKKEVKTEESKPKQEVKSALKDSKANLSEAANEQVHKSAEAPKKEAKPSVERKPENDSARAQSRSPERKENYQERRPISNQDAQRVNNNQNRNNTQQNGQRTFDRDRRDRGYSSGSSFDPFAKKRENMNREANGFRKPGQSGAEFRKPQQEKKPEIAPVVKNTPASSERPAQLAALEKQKQAELNRNKVQQAPAQPIQKEQKKDRAQKQQFKTIAPNNTGVVKGGVNIAADYNSESVSKTRVVDTRTSDVNLSKYAEMVLMYP